jgi:hypothetical protein
MIGREVNHSVRRRLSGGESVGRRIGHSCHGLVERAETWSDGWKINHSGGELVGRRRLGLSAALTVVDYKPTIEGMDFSIVA